MHEKKIPKGNFGMMFNAAPLSELLNESELDLSLDTTLPTNFNSNFNSFLTDYNNTYDYFPNITIPDNKFSNHPSNFGLWYDNMLENQLNDFLNRVDKLTYNIGNSLITNSSDPSLKSLGRLMVDSSIDSNINRSIDTLKKAADPLRKSRLNETPLPNTKGISKEKIGNIALLAGVAADFIGGFLPEKTEYSGTHGGVTQTMDTVYDGISDAAMSFGPIGMMVGGIMKGGKLLGGVANSLGGGTDGMTGVDAVLGSSFFNITPFGLINGFGGLKADTIRKDDLAFEQVGGSYTGTSNTIDDALEKSGKKYGLFSSGAREDANREIAEAKRLLYVMSDIANYASDRFAIRNSRAATNGNRRKYLMQGGFDQSAIRMGKKGMLLETVKKINQQQPEDQYLLYLSSLPKNQRYSTDYRTRDYWEFNGRPKDFKEALNKGMFSLESDGLYHAPTIASNPLTGELEFMKIPSQEELDYYNNLFGDVWELKKDTPYWKYTKSLKTGGIIKEVSIPYIIKEISIPYIIKEVAIHLKGGSIEQKSRSIEELIEYAKSQDLNWIKRWQDSNRITIPDWEKEGLIVTHKLSQGEGTDDNGNPVYYVYPKVQEIDGLLHDFTDPLYKHGEWDAYESAKKNGEVLRFNTLEEANLFIENYKKYVPGFDKYEKGGKFNVIPEGALHARKHNMDVEGITSKGIPVVSEGDNGKIELQAEIEVNEIILRLEVTKKLEELKKKYYSNDYSQKEKDEFAIEAGKLLTYEILENTQDNTGLINQIN